MIDVKVGHKTDFSFFLHDPPKKKIVNTFKEHRRSLTTNKNVKVQINDH